MCTVTTTSDHISKMKELKLPRKQEVPRLHTHPDWERLTQEQERRNPGSRLLKVYLQVDKT